MFKKKNTSGNLNNPYTKKITARDFSKLPDAELESGMAKSV